MTVRRKGDPVEEGMKDTNFALGVMFLIVLIAFLAMLLG